MTKKSIVLLLLLNLTAISLFADDDKNIWANYAKIPIPEDNYEIGRASCRERV